MLYGYENRLFAGMAITAAVALCALALALILGLVACGRLMFRQFYLRRVRLQLFIYNYDAARRCWCNCFWYITAWRSLRRCAKVFFGSWITRTLLVRRCWYRSLITAAYSARIFYGAMCETDRGEWEAALAFGLPPHKRLMRIVIPDAWRRALPAFGNEMIFLMHGSSVASIITLLDLTGAARTAARGTFHFSESYLLAIVLYMMLSAVIILATRQMEKYSRRHLQTAN